LLNLMKYNQFDTIYHEHFSYFSLLTVCKIFEAHGLNLFDVEELSTHGGSLRIYAKHVEDNSKLVQPSVEHLLKTEKQFGLSRIETYQQFAEQVRETKRALLSFLIRAKREGKTIVGYGAPAKGNTLLNYCGIGIDFLDYTVDRSIYKQGRYLPGTHIPIYGLERIAETRPDYVLILPWNLQEEIIEQMKEIRSWGGRFVVPIPEVRVIEA
ncbi:MAG: methyltransferase C-terminal domain-containing protein, partial [Tumebacillaceae bacterium]